MFYIIFIFVLLVIDQWTKHLIHSRFFEGETLGIIRDFFHLTYVKNRGVAFGIFQGELQIITLVSVVAVFAIAYYVYKYEKNSSIITKISYALIVAGALGNIIDRIFRGFVIDMIDFRGIWPYIFNVADMYINIGVALMLIDYFITERKKKEEEKLK
jgi:signal peptidase II